MKSELDAGLAALAQRLRRSSVRVHDDSGRGSGSGVVWAERGVVVTNAHVVRGRAATVEFENGGRFHANVLRRDDARDLAALSIPADAAAVPAAVRDSATLAPGELVVAVGNPRGLIGALTTGLVQRSNARFVVADVRLEPGNSGGALADIAGRVVGINSMVAGGLALAVPSSAVASFLGAAAAAPRRLGVRVVPVAALSANQRIPALLVTGVADGSVAQRAGLLLGDAIVATQGGAPRDTERLAAALGDATALEIVRGGRSATIVLPWDRGGEGARAA